MLDIRRKNTRVFWVQISDNLNSTQNTWTIKVINYNPWKLIKNSHFPNTNYRRNTLNVSFNWSAGMLLLSVQAGLSI